MTPVLEFLRQCHGECGGTNPDGSRRYLWLPLAQFSSNGHGGLRRVCRTCEVARVVARRRRRRETEPRECKTCHERKPIDEFARFSRGISWVCIACAEAEDAELDPVTASERDLERCAHQRWAIAFRFVLDWSGMTVADYKALRGARRLAFERAWDRVMCYLRDQEAGAETERAA